MTHLKRKEWKDFFNDFPVYRCCLISYYIFDEWIGACQIPKTIIGGLYLRVCLQRSRYVSICAKKSTIRLWKRSKQVKNNIFFSLKFEFSLLRFHLGLRIRQINCPGNASNFKQSEKVNYNTELWIFLTIDIFTYLRYACFGEALLEDMIKWCS
jgi:hypothetical protein